MRFQGLSSWLVAMTLVWASSAHAAVLNYSEPPDINATSFVLGVGNNTISGTSGFDGNALDYDDIQFVVAPGEVLVGLSINATLLSGDSFDLGWEMFTDGFGLGASLGRLDVFPTGMASFDGSLGLLAGDYFLFQAELPPGAGLASYTINLTVRELQEVPEPGALALAGLGLAVAASTRRRYGTLGAFNRRFQGQSS
jgi:PEP-CTERM motif